MTTTPAPTSPREAKARFYQRYGTTVGGSSTDHVSRYLGRTVVEPITVEGWIELAEEVRDHTPRQPASPAETPAASPPQLGFTFQTRARIADAEGTLTVSAGALRDLVLTVRQLHTVGAIQLVTEARVWQTTPDGRPICPKHQVPMKQREKQGDVWWSHNVGADNEVCYCKGYPGPDSPGYDR